MGILGTGCFPGADGSTIGGTLETIPIYGADGSSTLTEGNTGIKLVQITTNSVGEDNTTLMYATKEPLAFIYNSITPRDWYANSENYQNNTLWENGAKKSEYDPCPRGWCVPTDAELTYGDFSTFTFPYYIQGDQTSSGNANITNGRLYHKISWFPMTGRRNYDSGALIYAGNGGYYWTSPASGPSAKRLGINMNGIYLSEAASRAYGFAVRCIQE